MGWGLLLLVTIQMHLPLFFFFSWGYASSESKRLIFEAQ
jgi:hypothetical protein